LNINLSYAASVTLSGSSRRDVQVAQRKSCLCRQPNRSRQPTFNDVSLFSESPTWSFLGDTTSLSIRAGLESVPPKQSHTTKFCEHIRAAAHLFSNGDGVHRCRPEPTSQFLRIMMLSRLMPECDQKGTRWFAPIQSNVAANLFAARPVRPQFRHPIAGQFLLIQIACDLNAGSTGLRGGESPYPLRT